MKTLFTISSALHTKHGKFSSEERLNQTLDTLTSIRTRVPDAIININESSGESSITSEEFEKLKSYGANQITDYSKDPQVIQIYKSTDNWDIVKNLTEMLIMTKSLLPDGAWDDFTKITSFPSDRVFKLSGRYQLNNDFDLSKYDDPKLNDKYVFAFRRQSQFPANITGGLSQQLMSRLWSFPTNRIKLVFYRYNLMLEDFQTSLSSGKYRDIEHLLLKYFNGPNLVEFPIIGVSGHLGPNGQQVSD
jgi:hypothetical protein